MTNEVLLQLLKNDLQITTNANDSYLEQLLQFSLTQMERMGITIEVISDNDVNVASDEAIQVIQMQYASYLFRKRAGEETAMPRFLKRELNGLLLSQKMGSEES